LGFDETDLSRQPLDGIPNSLVHDAIQIPFFKTKDVKGIPQPGGKAGFQTFQLRRVIVKLLTDQVAYHRRGNQQLVGAQKCITGKMNQGQFFKSGSHFYKDQTNLGCGGIGNLSLMILS